MTQRKLNDKDLIEVINLLHTAISIATDAIEGYATAYEAREKILEVLGKVRDIVEE